MSSEKAREKKKRDQEVKNRIKNMTKEALAASLAKKKECNARAMQIVEKSIEPLVEKPWLMDNLKHINQAHFQDIVEERAITKICGYPLCVEELTNVPKKMYKISTRENKVYDITDRKNYCSNNCYKAGTFLKEQLYTSPLWLRDCEIPVEYEILTPAVAVKESGVGAEVDLGNTKPVQIDNNILKESTQEVLEYPIKETEILKRKSAHPAEVAMDINKTESETKTDSCVRSPALSPDVSSVNSTDSSHYSTADEQEFVIGGYDMVNSLVSNDNERKINTKRIVSSNAQEKALSKDILRSTLPAETLETKLETPKVKACRKKQRKGNPSIDIVKDIEKRIESWFTLETMSYVLGKEKLKELLKISGYVQDLLSKKSTRKSSSVEDYHFFLKCQEIEKRINIIELKDQEKQTPTKPVPDYNELKKDAKELEVIVRNFFRGDTKVSFADEEKHYDDDENAPVLPLIDHYSALSARRRIVIDRLNKALPDIQSALELSHFRLGSDLQEIVSTFNLTPTNITMRPAEWTLISVIIIKLLTLRNEILEYAFLRSITQKRLMPYLLSYDLDGGYLDRFISYLMDVDRVASLIPIE